ncbi:MAG: DUF5696 domain-containing protein [Aristaeellaceae bacterium]
MMKKMIVLCLLLLAMAGIALAASDERIPVAENDRLALYLSADHCGFDVLDKQSGVTWSSSMNDPTFTGKLAGLNEKKANSMLTVNVTNLEKGAGSMTNAVLLNDKKLTTGYELVENGVRLHYDLGNTGVALDVEVLLEGDTVLVRVPYESINAYGDFSVVSIDMMPYLCSGSDNADGFLFYPDGCGAILRFSDYAHFKELTQVFSVYGNTEKAKALLDLFGQEEPTVMMPVYGVSIGGNAMLAVIEDGAETARISLNSSNKIVAVNYVYATFQYRRGFDDLRVTSRAIKTYDKKAMEVDYSVRLMFLPAGCDTYSDMAVAYREYLIANGLTAHVSEQDVAIDLFMSAPEEGLLFDTQRTVTTLAQADAMLDQLAAAGVEKVHYSLKGWSRGGYGKFPDQLPVESAVGRNQELTALTKKAQDMGSTLSLTVNFVEADGDSHTYSRRNDVVYLSNYAILTDAEEETFILSPNVIREKYDAFAGKAASLCVGGLRLERMGQYIPFNYNRSYYYTTQQTLEIYRQMLQDAKARFGQVSVQGGAVWAAPYADLLTEVPYEDSGFHFTTESVPFYQMVMHGLRDYTGLPGNLSSDLEREFLRWVEMGYMPYFELTWGSTEELMYTDYQGLFTAQYTAWIDKVAGIAAAFSQGELKELRTVMMREHVRLTDELVRVTYENGARVYVNYADADAQADGLTIPAMDYLVVKGELE